MPRKAVLAAFVLILLLSLAVGGYFVLTSKSFSLSLKNIDSSGVARGINDAAPEAPVKLVYVGTNETLSEALYHSDLQDGKLSEPHIVFSVLEWDRNGAATKVELKFINKQNKVVKSYVEEGETNVKNLFVTSDGQIGAVTKKEGDKKIDYLYDINGNLLFKEKVHESSAGGWAPNNAYSVEFPNPEWLNLPPYQISVRDKHNTLINKYEYDPKGSLPFKVIFSKNSEYFAVLFYENYSKVIKIVLFSKKGDFLSPVPMNKIVIYKYIDNGQIYLTNDGNSIYFINAVSLVSGEAKQNLCMFDRKGNYTFIDGRATNYEQFAVSNDERYLVGATHNELILFDLKTNYISKVIYQGDLYQFEHEKSQFSGEDIIKKVIKRINNIWITNNANVLYLYSDSIEENQKSRQLRLLEATNSKILLETINVSVDSLLLQNEIILMTTSDAQNEGIYDSIYIFRFSR